MASVFEKQQQLDRSRSRLSDRAIKGEGIEGNDIQNVEEKFDPIALMEVEPHDHEHSHDPDHEEMSTTRKVVMLFVVILPLLGLASAVVYTWQYGMMSWLYLGMLIGGWYLTGLGITVGYHRQLTHRSFTTYSWMRYIWASLGALAVEGSPIDWCMVHRKHHQYSDHHGDPHSPHLAGDSFWGRVKGFFHSHVGWLFQSNWSKSERAKYIPDLVEEDYLMWVDRNYVWWVVASLAIPMVIGGLVTMTLTGAMLGLVWGGLARVAFTHHMTWAINSVCHVFGSRDFKSSDDSRNNLIFGIFSHGEGWHNNHHAFPSSARHGLKWWQFDLSWMLIRGMQLVGLAWDVRLPSDRAMEKKAVVKG